MFQQDNERHILFAHCELFVFFQKLVKKVNEKEARYQVC